MISQSHNAYRDIGRSLAEHISANPEAGNDPAVLTALIFDFAGSSITEIGPLRDLMRRASFQALVPLAHSKIGVVQRDALIKELETIYSEQTINGIKELLDGFLDLHGQSIARNTRDARAKNSNQVHIATPPATEGGGDGKDSSSELRPYAIKAGILTVALGALALLLYSPPLCRVSRLCSADQITTRPQTALEKLARAQRSAEVVREAKDPDLLHRALSRLQADIALIDPKTLSSDQLKVLADLKELQASSSIRDPGDTEEPKRFQPSSYSTNKNVAPTQPGPTQPEPPQPQPQRIDPATTIPKSAVETLPARPRPPEQNDFQHSRETPAIHQQLKPRPRVESGPSAPAITSPVDSSDSRGESQQQKRYSLPPAWEERRAKRREIMRNYSSTESAQ